MILNSKSNKKRLPLEDFEELRNVLKSIEPVLKPKKEKFLTFHPEMVKRFDSLLSYLAKYTQNIEPATDLPTSHIYLSELDYYIKMNLNSSPFISSYTLKDFSTKIKLEQKRTFYSNITREEVETLKKMSKKKEEKTQESKKR